MPLASCELRNAIAEAMSRDDRTRPRGCFAAKLASTASPSGSVARRPSRSGVSVTLGQTALTRMPSRARSREAARARLSSAPFEVQ